MAWALLMLLTVCTEFLSRPVLTQLPSASASLEASVTLTCTLSSGCSGYSMAWHQLSQRKDPFQRPVGNSGVAGSMGYQITAGFSGSGCGLHRCLTNQDTQGQDEADQHYRANQDCGISFV
ncbi:LOW QUALITY PROTEIN: IGLV9-49 isoform 1 [Pongo abelii]|uniref:IGLV9-49 isoform 1 n=1 Tax=Pongo abelii TaxID=9601 RepID=A0A2J8RZ76_PONAB|nr:LOW QUALITY PROTEIN: IGLV9-49 isoform 1 [Pongo abelii]